MTADGPKTSSDQRQSADRSRTASARVYHGSVRAFSVVFVVLGLAILAMTLANGGGPLSVGVLLGVAFTVVGGGRLWVSSRIDW